MSRNRILLLTSSSDSSSEEEAEVYLKRRKLYRKRKDRFDGYDDLDFFDRFRLLKPTVLALLQLISHLITSPTRRGGSISPMVKILLTLRFYATGSMLIAMGDFMGVSKSSACRIIKNVSEAIATLRPKFIKMCQTAEEMGSVAEQFYELASFPRVIGAIDCSLIKIQSVGGEDAEIFRSRKGFFAINVQTVSDATLKISNIVARWPGSAHDQTIFNNCTLKREFDTGRYGQYLIVGDSGYSIQPYLMTNLQEAQTEAENLYNESIIRTRNVVERQYGVWKRRFPILSLGIRLSLETTLTVIVATAVLHNIALEMKDMFPSQWFQDLVAEEQEGENIEDGMNVQGGRQVRQMIINQHFANL